GPGPAEQIGQCLHHARPRGILDGGAGDTEHHHGPVLPHHGRLPLLLAPDGDHLVVRDLRVGAATRGARAVRHHHAAEPAVVEAETLDDAGIALDLEVVGMGGDAHVGGAREGGLFRDSIRNPHIRLHRWSFPFVRSAAEGASRYTVVPGCRWRTDAGCCGVTGPSRQSRTACALRASGTMHRISSASRIWRIDIEIARWGTSSRRGNQPSPSCCRRQASSRETTRYGSFASKSAGGSLKARCPFSPMPTKATSMGCDLMSAPTRAASAFGSGASPSMKWNWPGRTLSTIRSRRQGRK